MAKNGEAQEDLSDGDDSDDEGSDSESKKQVVQIDDDFSKAQFGSGGVTVTLD